MRRLINAAVLLLIVVNAGGLLAVCIAKVQEASGRVGCKNNLRQIGLALYNYVDTYARRRFPTAALPNPALLPEARLSWLVDLSPFVEADDIYAKMDKEQGWEAEENRFAALFPYRTYLCPAYREATPASTLVQPNYIGIAGVGEDAASLPRGNPRAGFLGYDRKLTLRDVQGRRDTLLLVLETSRPEGAWTAAGPPTVRGLNPGGLPYLGDGGQFGGLHRGGTNVLFAGGSVRFVSQGIKPELLESLAVLRGGEDLSPIGDD